MIGNAKQGLSENARFGRSVPRKIQPRLVVEVEFTPPSRRCSRMTTPRSTAAFDADRIFGIACTCVKKMDVRTSAEGKGSAAQAPVDLLIK